MKTATIAAIESRVPSLVETREIIAAFDSVIRKTSSADIVQWLERAQTSPVASFASGVFKDREAVSAAMTPP